MDEIISDRMTLPPGLYLVTERPGCKSLTVVSKICEVPSNPDEYVNIKMRGTELADFIYAYKESYRLHPTHNKGKYSWAPSDQALANAILDEFVKKAGIKMVVEEELEDRRLDPDL